MFYWLYLQYSHYLQSLDPAGAGYVPVLNLLKYQTFRTGLAIFTSQLVVVAMGSRFIRWMKARQGKGQPIRAEGIERHVLEKSGTPTMGGVMILAGLLTGTVLWSDLANPYVWAVILVTAVSSPGLSGGLAANWMISATAAMAIRASSTRRARPEMPAVVCVVTFE